MNAGFSETNLTVSLTICSCIMGMSGNRGLIYKILLKNARHVKLQTSKNVQQYSNENSTKRLFIQRFCF